MNRKAEWTELRNLCLRCANSFASEGHGAEDIVVPGMGRDLEAAALPQILKALKAD